MKKLDSGKNYARYALGNLSVIALRDGYIDMPSSRLRQRGDRPFGSDLPDEVTLVGGKLRLSVNAFMVIDGDQHILIDTGAANAWEPTMGSLLDAMKEAGVGRDSVGTVAVTHTHEDHINGLVAADGSDAFPNLDRLFVPKNELSMFDSEKRLARFRDRRQSLEDGFKLSSSITALQAHGHEVGHTAFAVTSGGENLLIWGDIIHVPSIQFARPEIAWEYDSNQTEARSTRQKMLRHLIDSNSFVAGAHLDFPGIGKVTEIDGAFSYAAL
jgi:glyoxylase-like metal-dependent hydrolase (beta-lactamase superfamily II)